ncbi:MAG: IclR family transcriptional regulator [Pararhodobacter sp.]|nr:IclR family transcriptional regulator [Pararhodobacter sp.]
MNSDEDQTPPEKPARRRGRPRHDIGAAAINDDRPFVSSLARGMAILRAFRAEDRVLGTQVLAERTGLHKTTVSRLLGTLTKLGYLRYLPEYGKYAVSNQVLTLGYAALGRHGFGEMVRTHLEAIAGRGDCVAALSVRDGSHMMFVELIRKPTAVVLNLNVGSRIPLAESAPGRAYLFALSPQDRAEVYEMLATLHGDAWEREKRPALDAALERMAREGYSSSFCEWQPRHIAIGVPILDPLTRDIFTISVGCNSANVSRETMLKEHLPLLLNASREISTLSGSSFASNPGA